MRPVIRTAIALAGLVGLAAAGGCTCGSSEPEPVAKLCEKRAGWSRRLKVECTECVAFAKSPRGCRATERDYSARCERYQHAKLAAKPCEPVFRCADKCKSTDCGCVASCFDGQSECERIAAAVEGCLLRVCDAHCR